MAPPSRPFRTGGTKSYFLKRYYKPSFSSHASTTTTTTSRWVLAVIFTLSFSGLILLQSVLQHGSSQAAADFFLRALASQHPQPDQVKKNDQDATRQLGKKDNLIPKNIHLIYASPGLPEEQPAIPEYIQEYLQSWKDLHPTWHVKLWDNAAIRQHFPSDVPMLQKMTPMAFVADVLRYMILDEYGGFYFDTDIVPMRSLEPLRQSHGLQQAWAVCQSPSIEHAPFQQQQLAIVPDLVEDCHLLCNSVMASVPGHPALQKIRQVAHDNARENAFHNLKWNIHLSGPPTMTKVVKDLNVTGLKSFTFFPCLWSNKEDCIPDHYKHNPNVFGMHLWKHSWRK